MIATIAAAMPISIALYQSSGPTMADSRWRAPRPWASHLVPSARRHRTRLAPPAEPRFPRPCATVRHKHGDQYYSGQQRRFNPKHAEPRPTPPPPPQLGIDVARLCAGRGGDALRTGCAEGAPSGVSERLPPNNQNHRPGDKRSRHCPRNRQGGCWRSPNRSTASCCRTSMDNPRPN
jgi:hypothetical protein